MSDYISIISSLIIFLFPYIGRKWLETQRLSSIVISMGILCTFGYIMYGLWTFNIERIDFSIPQLLECLKTALLTTIIGLLSSLLLKIVPSVYGIKAKINEEEITEKQLFEVLTNIEKNTKVSPSVTSYLNNNISEQINTTLLKICSQHEQLDKTLSKLHETSKNIELSLGKSNNLNINQDHSFMEQMTSFGEFIKGSEQKMNLQLSRMDEKYEQKILEFEKFTKTLTAIIKKLSQDHDTLYRKVDEVE